VIIIIHDNSSLVEVLNKDLNPINYNVSKNEKLTQSVLEIAKANSQELLIWCHKDLKESLDLTGLSSVFHHKNILATFNTDKNYYLSSKIEFLERSICLNFNKKTTYGTYLMSSQVGGIFAETLLAFSKDININQSFNYSLNSIAKNYQINGLFCYSEPKLLLDNYSVIKEETISDVAFFIFVREHFKWVWVWYILIALIVYSKKYLLLPFLKSWLYSQKTIRENLNLPEVKSSIAQKYFDIDVVIPTIGRKEYLLDVLKDLASQTILPKQVIIVEQNGDIKAQSELDYLYNLGWPFQITHKFTHVLGVCNARNEALKELKNDWVFFADDDIRFHTTLFQESLDAIQKYGVKALNYSCLQPHQKQTYFNTGQTFIFGSGSSFVSSEIAKQINFNKGFEFGFGEDTDYGAKIRQLGNDVVFTANINLTHLKAPIGGFRQPIPKLWDTDVIMPKPSPTVILLYLKHFTVNQLKGYKLFLFFKIYGKKNPLKLKSHINKFKQSWNKSVFYANKLSAEANA
jgi:glycosyltransferase involved in cell wall biosynthesis